MLTTRSSGRLRPPRGPVASAEAEPVRIVAYLSEAEMQSLRGTQKVHPGLWIGASVAVALLCIVALWRVVATPAAAAPPPAGDGFTMVVSGTPAPTADLVPGKCLAGMMLGSPVSEHPELMTAPQTRKGDFLRITLLSSTVWVDSSNTIVGIAVHQGSYQTAGGIKIGSAKKDVLSVFGTDSVFDNNELRYDKDGIAFEFDTADQVSGIRVFPPTR